MESFTKNKKKVLDSTDSQVANRRPPLLDDSDSDSEDNHWNDNSGLNCDDSNVDNIHLLLNDSDSDLDEIEEKTDEDMSQHTQCTDKFPKIVDS